MLFFRIYLDFFFRFLFFFVLFFIFIEKKVPSPQRERRSQVFRRVEKRGMRRGERMKGGTTEKRRRMGGGLRVSFSLLSLPLSLFLVRLSGIWVLCVKFLLLVWFLVGDGRLFGFLQRVAALVLLLHPVNKQHHEEGGKQGAHNSSYYHRWRETDRNRRWTS